VPPPLTGLAGFKPPEDAEQQPEDEPKVRRTLFGIMHKVTFTDPIGFVDVLVIYAVAGLIIVAVVSLIVWKWQKSRAG